MCHWLYANEGKGNRTWYELAEEYGFEATDKAKATGDEKTIRDSAARSARSAWESWQKKTPRDLHKTKEILRRGKIEYETWKKRPRDFEEYNTEDFQLDAITTNPHGGAWGKYKRIHNVENLDTVINKLFDKYSKVEFKNFVPENSTLKKHDKQVAVVNLYDAHLDKLPVKSTCDVESSFEENLQTFKNTIDNICDYLKTLNLDKIYFPIGNDLFHTNGMDNKTKKGTEIEYFLSPEDAYYSICDIITESILKIRNCCHDLEIIMIKGNHDEDKITTLGYWLSRMFKLDDHVIVDYSRKQMKHKQFGRNLLSFAHGDKEKNKIAQIPLLVAQRNPILWAQTAFRKCFCGDLHHGFEFQFLKAKDYPGYEVEFLRSVGTTDTWHENFGWSGIPKTAYVTTFNFLTGEDCRKKFPII